MIAVYFGIKIIVPPSFPIFQPFIFRCFLLISGVKSLKKVEKEQKRLKTAEKSSSTSFWVQAAPESWSKYTTSGNSYVDFSPGKYD